MLAILRALAARRPVLVALAGAAPTGTIQW